MINFASHNIQHKIACLVSYSADIRPSKHNKQICLKTLDYWIDLFDGGYIVGPENQIKEVRELLEKTKILVQSHLELV